MGDLYEHVMVLAGWSGWRPWSEGVDDAPRTPGVYLFRLAETGQIVYVGMSGDRKSGGGGVRARLRVYVSGKAATSGFGQAALDRALADEGFVEEHLRLLREGEPRRASRWTQDAIGCAGVELCWAACASALEAKELEKQIETLLLREGLWNRVALR